jgi:hypothetical protein
MTNKDLEFIPEHYNRKLWNYGKMLQLYTSNINIFVNMEECKLIDSEETIFIQVKKRKETITLQLDKANTNIHILTF